MDFVWNDGGRAACGFVGVAGDCVTRAIAIATGGVYRQIYQALGDAALKSPRDGVDIQVSATYLARLGWERHNAYGQPFLVENLPKGIVIVSLARDDGRGRHLCTLVDRVIHDTWDPSEDDDYCVLYYWTRSAALGEPAIIQTNSQRPSSQEQELTQAEFDKILRRLRALDNTANNDASTEGEKHNALRMMQSLMLRHNLSRDDISDDDNVENIQFARIVCPVNGRRACSWEVALASYVTGEIFPTVQWYRSSRGHRTMFWFYGSLADVRNAIALFRELLLTIATSAQLRYGGYTRGSGASYAEGYVSGLPRNSTSSMPSETQSVSSHTLIQTRTLAMQQAANYWLNVECNTKLTTTVRSGRGLHDENAARKGKSDGASQTIDRPGSPKRLGHG